MRGNRDPFPGKPAKISSFFDPLLFSPPDNFAHAESLLDSQLQVLPGTSVTAFLDAGICLMTGVTNVQANNPRFDRDGSAVYVGESFRSWL